MNSDKSDVAAIEELGSVCSAIKSEMAKTLHGQTDVIEKLCVCIFSRGHGLLMGVPGLAKTLMIQTLSKLMSLKFSRIQFTPDLMPSDITGTEILQETERPGHRAFDFVKGPVFANIVLADEINRTPPKTQAALLQAMQERHVTSGGVRFDIPAPFFVLATQNPFEFEGTYPLPENQLDRFMLCIEVGYPDRSVEKDVLKHHRDGQPNPGHCIRGANQSHVLRGNGWIIYDYRAPGRYTL